MVRNALWADTKPVALLSQLCKPVSYQKSWAEKKKGQVQAGFEELTSDIMMTGMCGWIPRWVQILLASGLRLHYRGLRSVLTSVLSFFVYSRDEHISVIYWDRCSAALDYGSPRKGLELHVKYSLQLHCQLCQLVWARVWPSVLRCLSGYQNRTLGHCDHPQPLLRWRIILYPSVLQWMKPKARHSGFCHLKSWEDCHNTLCFIFLSCSQLYCCLT